MARKAFRLGVCTGGGDCPGLNAAIRAATRHAILSYKFEVYGIPNGLTGLLHKPQEIQPLTLDLVDGIADHGGTILGTNNQGSPFRNAEQAQSVKAAMIKAWQRLKLDAMLVIGGDGTQNMAKELAAAGLAMTGIPKTIDNDLCGTDQTIGFATAVEVASAAAQRLTSCATALNRVMLLEVMGRDAGHIALHSAIAASADIALLPEIPFQLAGLMEHLAIRHKSGHAATVIIVAEGAAPKGGERSFQTTAKGNRMLGGIAAKLAHLIQEQGKLDARATVLGHLQRGGAPNAEDKILAARFGVAAIDRIAAGKTGSIVCASKGRFYDLPYRKVQDRRRVIDLKSDQIRTAESVGIWLGRNSKSDSRS